MLSPIKPHKNPMGRVQHIHFVGIGGIGMSGIAEVLLNQGYTISGSDLLDNSFTQRLRSLGATCFKGHSAEHIKGADVIVFSSALDASNPELQAAREQAIPIIPRAQMLAELMRFQYGIAISGTHGKTTTTSLTASLLAEGGLDPTFVIGGKVNHFGSSARLGDSRYFVAEADESDASFLHLKPILAVVTNIDAEHLIAYDNKFDNLCNAFLAFLHHLPFYGTAVVCLDDPTIKTLLPKLSRPTITYGLDKAADVRLLECEHKGLQTHCTVQRHDQHPPLSVTLNFPGTHNILNALAAITVATLCGVSDKAIARGLATFSGISRRFQLHGEYQLLTQPGSKQVTLIEDYGHHPSEITHVINTIRQVWPKRRLILVFQPHRYTRTQALFDAFTQALSQADQLLLLDIYPASEPPIAGINSQRLCQAIHPLGRAEPTHVKNPTELCALLNTITQTDDIILAQGAGNIGQLVKGWTQTWQRLADTKVS